MNDEIHELDDSTVITWAVRAIRMGTNRYVESLIADLLESKGPDGTTQQKSNIPDNFNPKRAVDAFLTSHDEELSTRALGHLHAALLDVSQSRLVERSVVERALQQSLEHHEDREGRIPADFHPIYERRLKQLFKLLGEWIHTRELEPSPA